MTRRPLLFVFGSLALSLGSSVAAQESRALLDAPLVVSPSQRLGTVLDLDGDGYQDSVGWWFSSSNSTRVTIYPFLNDQHGALVRANSSWVSLTPNGSQTPGGQCFLQKCNLDNDGRDDFGFIFLGSGPSLACAFASNGTAAPRLVPTYSFPGVRCVVYADFDGDGVCDAAVTRGNTLEIYSFAAVPGGDPVGTLRSVQPLPAATDELFALDGNGDGLLDLYVNMGGTGRIYPVVDFACGTSVNFAHGVTTMPMPIAGDIDADGDTDLIVFSMTSYVTLRRTGRATWNQEPEHLGGPATHLVDVDQDGDLDGVCCGGGQSIPTNRGPSTFRVALNDGHGGFAPAFEMPGLGSDRIAGAVDLDHDGDVDLVGGRCVYYSRGGIRRSMMPLLGDLDGLKVHVNDFDGDLDPDFEVKYPSVKRNLGDGSGDTVSAFWPPPGAGSTFGGPGFTGDFDGDGDVDLLVQKRTGSVVTLWLLTNDGGGRFYDAGAAGPTGYDFAYALPGMVDSRALKLDVDGDGAVDLVVRDSQLSRTRIHLNDGTGRFLAAPVTIPSVIAAIADLNGDGILDLVASMPTTGVYLGHGNLTYSALTSFGTDGYISTDGVAVGDLDGDSDLDVAITPYGSLGSRRVEIFWNSGVGTFTREVMNDLIVSDYGLYGNPGNMTIVDLDGDGRLDLVCGPSVDYAAAYVLRRRSDNTGFEPAIQQTLYMDSGDGRTVVNSATCIDVDGDGDLDLVSERLVRIPRWSGLEHGARRQNTTGNPGANGRTPTLGENGPFQVGSTVTLRLTGAAPFASGMLVVGWDHGQSPPFHQGPGPMHAQRVQITSVVPFTTSGTAGFDGSGTWSLTYQVPPYKAGRTYQYRAYIDDASAVDGRSASNVLWITYGY